MTRLVSVLFLLVFLVASGKTAQSLSTNGDTALIMLQTIVCVILLSAAVYCKNQQRAGAD